MITTKGRLVYIEPNDIKNNLLGFSKGSGEGDNVYWRPEDLNISVDLQVFLSDRNSCGALPVGDNFLVNVSASNDFERKWQTFFNGTEIAEGQKYLTTEYTNISYQEIRENKAGGKESLGIQSIDIQFDSHFFPIVKMKLVDVRGYSLMMPAEIQYDSNVKSDVSKTARKKACEQFFDAVFHFPYPRFALSIKGYYGDRITLMLAVNDFQSSFNSQTGNFEIEISFIGHMYGLYADLPTSFIFVAPYLGSTNGSKSAYWTNQVANGTFTLSDGTPIPTFKEVVENFDRMAPRFKETYGENSENYQHINTVEHLNSEKKQLNETLATYNNLFIETGKATGIDSVMTFNDERMFLYFTSSVDAKLPSNETLNKKIEEYNTFMEGTFSIGPINDKIKWGEQLGGTEDKLFNETGNTIVEDHPYKKDLDGKITDVSDNIRSKRVFLFKKDKNFIDSINKRLSEIENEIVNQLSVATDEIDEVAQKVLGFIPSIENVIRIIFAHIDAFVTEFYNVLNNIKGKMNNERRLKNFNYSIDNTNISTKGTSNCFIPPFTTFYKYDKTINEKVRIYPGDVSSLSNLDEVQFVEDFYKAAEAAKIEEYIEMPIPPKEETESETSEEGEAVEDFKKLSVLDLLETKNPYRQVEESSDIISKLKEFVITRFNDARAAGASISELNIEYEVQNFLDVHKQYLMAGDEASKKIISEIDKEIKKLEGEEESTTNLVEKKEEEKSPSPSPYQSFDNYAKEKIEPLIESYKVSESFNNKKGYHIIGTDPDKEYSDDIKLFVKKDWDYSVGSNFYGNIYLSDKYVIKTDSEGKTKIEEAPENTEKEAFPSLSITKEDRKKYIELSRDNAEKFNFPMVPYDVDTNIFFPLYRSIINKDKKQKSIDASKEFASEINVISCLVGTSNLYHFSESKRIIRMPLPAVLFLGGSIAESKKEEHPEFKETFNIDTDGLFYKFSVKKKKRAAKLSGKITTKQLIDSDKNGNRLEKYYNDKKSVVKELIDLGFEWGERTSKNSAKFAKGQRILDTTENRPLIDKLISFCNSTVDLLLVEEKSVIKDYTKAKEFLKKLKNEMNGLKKPESATEEKSSDNGSNSEGGTNSFSAYSGSSLLKKNKKEQLYYTCSDLYDKWFAGYPKERFLLKSPDKDRSLTKRKMDNKISANEFSNITEIDNFIFIDTFYNDIGQKFMVDPKIFANVLSSAKNRSVLQSITDITQQNKLLFIPLPVFTNMYDANSIASIFTPHGLYGNNEVLLGGKLSRGIGSTYVIMYTHQPSNHANTDKRVGNSSAYANDVFDIADCAGNISPTSIELLTKSRERDDYKLPAFGVTFASQNQMYFKGIHLNMSNPRQTEQSIQNQFELAAMGRKGETRLGATTLGQNLYSIYSNRAYDCTVEMMGCMNIMPLLYFQLNNIPLFRGGYRIVTVKHHIENGSMTTTFTGTRINKTAIQYNSNVIDVEGLINKIKEDEARGIGYYSSGSGWIGSTMSGNNPFNIKDTKDKEGYELWITCCENMASYYQNNVTTYRGSRSYKELHCTNNEALSYKMTYPCVSKDDGGQYLNDEKHNLAYYECTIGEFTGKVADDCCSFARACLAYFSKTTKGKYSGTKFKYAYCKTMGKYPYKQVNGKWQYDEKAVEKNETTEFYKALTEHGWTNFAFDGDYSKLKKGDILNGPQHTEIYWGQDNGKDKSLSWGSIHNPSVTWTYAASKNSKTGEITPGKTVTCTGLPCATSKSQYTDVYRYIG